MNNAIRVINPKERPSTEIPCERIQVGGRRGYKPNVVKFSDGELLMANFHDHYETDDDGSNCVHTVLHRSSDGGKTWASKHFDHLIGKEPYLNVLPDDSLIMTAHIYPPDIHAYIPKGQEGFIITTWIHCSQDRGRTWTSHRLDTDMMPAKVSMAYTTRNVTVLDDGSIAMGVGCGYGNDYLLISRDKGVSWDINKMQVSGCDAKSYDLSFLCEGIFLRTDSNRLLLFARCNHRTMSFDEIPGLPERDLEGIPEYDQREIEIIFESKDEGHSWDPLFAIPIESCMYPSICHLGEDKYLFTFTKRCPGKTMHMGVYAFTIEELEDGSFQFDCENDLIVIDEKTPDYLQSGGGFGNTLMLDDGTLLTPYSYYHADPEIAELMQSGKFLDEDTFNYYQNKALRYYRHWVKQVSWESMADRLDPEQRHCFLGCCQVMNLCGPVTEVAKWKLEF